MSIIKCGSDYDKYLNVDRYLEVLYSPSSIYIKVLEFMIEALHVAFENEKVRGKDLLDIGSGPTIHAIISACKNVERIYMSDYAKTNIETLKKWWKGKRKIQEHMIKQVCLLEGNGQTVEDRVKQMRQQVKDIVHIDILLPDPLNGSDIPHEYDVITSCFCLEAAVQNRNDYIKCVQNVNELLKPGGHLVMVGDLDNVYIMVDDQKMVGLRIAATDVKSIYREFGFNIQSFKEIPFKNEDDEDASSTTFIMVAQKNT